MLWQTKICNYQVFVWCLLRKWIPVTWNDINPPILIGTLLFAIFVYMWPQNLGSQLQPESQRMSGHTRTTNLPPLGPIHCLLKMLNTWIEFFTISYFQRFIQKRRSKTSYSWFIRTWGHKSILIKIQFVLWGFRSKKYWQFHISKVTYPAFVLNYANFRHHTSKIILTMAP